MLRMVRRYRILADGYPYNLLMDEHNKTIVFSHGDLVFVFNWHPTASIPDYELPVRRGTLRAAALDRRGPLLRTGTPGHERRALHLPRRRRRTAAHKRYTTPRARPLSCTAAR